MIRRPPISTLLPSPPLFRPPLQPPRLRLAVDGADRLRRPGEGGIPLVDDHVGEDAGDAAARRGRELGGRERADLGLRLDRKSTRLNSSHANISYAVFCLKKN